MEKGYKSLYLLDKEEVIVAFEIYTRSRFYT